MKAKILISVSFILGFMLSCTGQNKSEDQTEAIPPKTLILYYSQTGTTKQVAEEIQKQLNADIDSIIPVESYGYDYDKTVERWINEREDSINVAIKPLHKNINEYDTIFLGFPIWGGTYASPIKTYLSNNSLNGKTVITFATFGSGGIEPATKDVANVQPNANVIEGYGVRNSRISKSESEINRFLTEKGYKKGMMENLPEYGPMMPVTPAEEEIFKQACGDYKFPLGSPVSVSKRNYDGITDYKYEVKSQNSDGRETNSVIYVTLTPNEKPEFTRVVRQ